MDETANQMRDVRERLIETLDGLDYLLPLNQIVDAILARFDVTEKPVVTDAELGQMVVKVHGENSFYHVDIATKVGERLRNQLERAGLAIVRSGEAAR